MKYFRTKIHLKSGTIVEADLKKLDWVKSGGKITKLEWKSFSASTDCLDFINVDNIVAITSTQHFKLW